MGKCRCVLLTLLSSAYQFHHNRKHCIFHTEIYTQHKTQDRKVRDLWKTFERFLWFLKTIWVLQQPNVLLRTFWGFVLIWRDNSPRKGRTRVKVFFSAVETWGLFKYSRSKNVLKHLSVNEIGWPFFKNKSFRNANSLRKLVQLEQIEKHRKTKA